MRAILAMTAATWKAASSYRVSMVLSLLGLVMSVIPLYFVAGALQDTMSGTIRGEGGQYFAFVLAGMLSMTIVTQAVSALPSSVGSARLSAHAPSWASVDSRPLWRRRACGSTSGEATA